MTDTSGPADFKIRAAVGPTTSRSLSEDFAAFAGLEPGKAPVVQLPDGRPAVFHFLGSAWSSLLEALLEDLPGPKPQQSNPFCTVVGRARPVLPRNLEPETVAATIARNADRLSRRIPLGPWSREMPPSWRSENLLQILNPELFTRTVCNLTECQEPVPEEHQEAFARLAASRW